MATPLSKIDPAFIMLAREVYGPGADPRELWDIAKSMPGASDVHVPNADPKKQKRIAQTGLAATGVATVGGLHAIHATLKAAKTTAPEAKTAGKIVGKLPIKNPKAAAAVGTAGWLGLHGVELVGDSLAARAQVKSIKEAKKTPGATGTIGKAQVSKVIKVPVLPKVDPRALVSADSRARRNGMRVIVAGAAGGGYAAGAQTRPVTARIAAARKQKVADANPDGPVAKVDSRVIEISKLDDDKHLIFGWANLAEKDGQKVIDLQGDYVSIDEIEKSAYSFMLTSRKGGDMHKRLSKFQLDAGPVHVADVVESFVVTPEKLEAMGLAPDALPLGWWTGMKVNDEDVWQKVKSGEYTGLSIHGSGTRSDMVFA